jgi:hypothetical protein
MITPPRYPFDTPSDDDANASPLRLTITLYPPQDRATHCHACGAECAVRYGLPVDETGQYVESDYVGEWCGVPACKACYDAHARGGVVGLTIRLDTIDQLRKKVQRNSWQNIARRELARMVPVIGEVQT